MESRPLEEVPTKALYALHRGIEKQTGLINTAWVDSCGGKCALGSLGVNLMTFEADLVDRCNEVGLSARLVDNRWPELGVVAESISELNSSFMGTPEERREFMLRAIINELRHRGKSLPATTSRVVHELESVCP